MKIGYTFTPENEGFVAKATGKELRIKFKDAIEICAAIQGMKAKEAVTYLEKVLEQDKTYIPFKKAKTQHGHKPGMKPFGAQPIRAVAAILIVLKSAIANAEFRGLDLDGCIVKSAVAQRGHKLRRMKPKGRHAAFESYLTNVQIFVEEASE